MRALFLYSLLIPCVSWAGDWKLVWADEFDKNGLPSPEKWNHEVGFIRNTEAQYYTSNRQENARIQDGKLVIQARKEEFKNSRYEAGSPDPRRKEFAEYTSASLTTKGLAHWTFGKVEVRAKLPQGRGVWPAIWMLGTNISRVGWPRCGEIDIMEYVGFEPDVIHANIHTAKYNHVSGTGKGSKITIKKPFEDFHTFALEWYPGKLEFIVDGQKYFTYVKEPEADANSWPFDKPQYLILNLAIGGAWGGQKGIDEAIFPQRFEIDYVRVYQSK